MKTLTLNELPLGGFGGLTEKRLVQASQVFGARKNPLTEEGIGDFVYLADANFQPHGETGMHPHSEVDVISLVVDGRISHAGSLEHGKSLETGDIQVQRAGGEGFSHNEINPDSQENRLLQLWVLPEVAGQKASYKVYKPQQGSVTPIYGGVQGNSNDTFASHTKLDMAKLNPGQKHSQIGEALIYVINGEIKITEEGESKTVTKGTLIRAHNIQIEASSQSDLVLIYQH